jgi:hypothetical protein
MTWKERYIEGMAALEKAKVQKGKYTLDAAKAFDEASSMARSQKDCVGMVTAALGFVALAKVQDGGGYTHMADRVLYEARSLADSARSTNPSLSARFYLCIGEGYLTLAAFQSGGKYTVEAAKVFDSAQSIACDKKTGLGVRMSTYQALALLYDRLAGMQDGGIYGLKTEQSRKAIEECRQAEEKCRAEGARMFDKLQSSR